MRVKYKKFELQVVNGNQHDGKKPAKKSWVWLEDDDYQCLLVGEGKSEMEALDRAFVTLHALAEKVEEMRREIKKQKTKHALEEERIREFSKRSGFVVRRKTHVCDFCLNTGKIIVSLDRDKPQGSPCSCAFVKEQEAGGLKNAAS